jgi:hypothetical protein
MGNYSRFILPLNLTVALAFATIQLIAAEPGLQPDGSMLLPNLWSLRPAGSQIELADFP